VDKNKIIKHKLYFLMKVDHSGTGSLLVRGKSYTVRLFNVPTISTNTSSSLSPYSIENINRHTCYLGYEQHKINKRHKHVQRDKVILLGKSPVLV
jgi:hypothetical protein